MKKIENIQEVYDAEINLIIKQSSILLQKKTNSFNGELKTSGTIVENYVKGIIRKHVPSGYRVCSGYIATVDSIASMDNLIQHDVIIVDDRIPTLYKFDVSDIEIVQAEAVCGILEIKRTLTRKSIEDAISQLRTTKDSLKSYSSGIKSKYAMNNAAGPTMNIATHSPLYGIISLGTNHSEIESEFVEETIKPEIHEFVDIIWSLSDGVLFRFCVENDGNVYYPLTVSRKMEAGYSFSHSFSFGEEQNKGQIFRLGLSIFRTLISKTAGTQMKANVNQKYFGV